MVMSVEEYIGKQAERFGMPKDQMESLLMNAAENGQAIFYNAVKDTPGAQGTRQNAIEQIVSAFKRRLNGGHPSPRKVKGGALPIPSAVGQVGVHLARYSKLQEREHALEIELENVRKEIERYKPIKGLIDSLGRAVAGLAGPEGA